MHYTVVLYVLYRYNLAILTRFAIRQQLLWTSTISNIFRLHFYFQISAAHLP